MKPGRLPRPVFFLVLQLRLHEREPSAPVAGLSDGLVRPAPEGPGQDEGRRRRAAAGCQAGDQAADLGHAERHQELASGSRAPFSLFRPARSPGTWSETAGKLWKVGETAEGGARENPAFPPFFRLAVA